MGEYGYQITFENKLKVELRIKLSWTTTFQARRYGTNSRQKFFTKSQTKILRYKVVKCHPWIF